MKKMLLALIATGFLSGLAWADSKVVVAVPTDQKGAAAHPFYGGYKYKRMTATTEALICTAPCILADLIMGTSSSGYVLIRDTGATGESNNATVVLPQIPFAIATQALRPVIHFPIRATYGFTVDIINGSGVEEVTAIYMDLD
jgi:hypothetical protein